MNIPPTTFDIENPFGPNVADLRVVAFFNASLPFTINLQEGGTRDVVDVSDAVSITMELEDPTGNDFPSIFLSKTSLILT